MCGLWLAGLCARSFFFHYYFLPKGMKTWPCLALFTLLHIFALPFPFPLNNMIIGLDFWFLCRSLEWVGWIWMVMLAFCFERRGSPLYLSPTIQLHHCLRHSGHSFSCSPPGLTLATPLACVRHCLPGSQQNFVTFSAHPSHRESPSQHAFERRAFPPGFSPSLPFSPLPPLWLKW